MPAPGQVPTGGVPGSSMQGAFDDQRRRAMIGGTIAGSVLLVVAIFFGMRAFGNLQANQHSGDPVLVATKKQEPAILQATAQVDPVLNKEARKPVDVKMPQDVMDWLKHLEKCEAMKVAIAGDQTAELSVVMTKFSVLGAGMGLTDPYDQSTEGAQDQDPSTYAKGKMDDPRPRWLELQRFFESYPPPAECKPLADDFGHALSEIPGMVGDLSDLMNTVMADPQSALQKVKKLQGGSYGNIDRNFAKADQKLSQICSKYKENKWFNIKGDVLAGGMLGGFSAPGMGGTAGAGGAGIAPGVGGVGITP